jgi:integrase
MRATNQLSAVKIARLTKPGRYCDGQGLYLQVSPGGSKAWLFRYMRDGVARQMGLGALHTIGLQQARALALRARQELHEGRDPIDMRKAAKQIAQLEAARSTTFRDCAERYLDAHEASWRNPKHRAQWRASLETYAYPHIGNLPVSAVDTALVLRVLEPIWTAKRETAGRVRGRIESILDWAAARSLRKGDNPARWRGHLDKLLAARAKHSVRHHPAMPYGEVPVFVRELQTHEGISARALEFTLLTAARTGEAIGAMWAEIDLDAQIWAVPARRMKSGRPHRVPLSDRCVEILRALPRIQGCPYLFPSPKPGNPLSNMAMAELLKGMRSGLTVHGFRSSFKDWATEQTDHARDIVEAALAHVVGDKVEAAYRRGDALKKRRALMADWAAFCMSADNRALAAPTEAEHIPGHSETQLVEARTT